MLVGCVDTDITVDLDKDGTVKGIIEVLGPKQIFDNFPEEQLNQLKSEFAKVEEISNNNKSGYKFISKKEKLMDIFKEYSGQNKSNTKNSSTNKNNGTGIKSTSVNLSTNTKDNTNDLQIQDYTYKFAKDFYKNYVKINDENSLFIDTYTVNLNIKDAIEKDMSSEQKFLLNWFGKTSTFGVHIKSPIQMKDSNATSIVEEDNKYVYNWDYNLNEIQNINFTVDIPNIQNILIAAISVILFVVIIIIFIVRRKKRRRRYI